MTDTSTEAVERLAAIYDGMAVLNPEMGDEAIRRCIIDTAAILRALLAERDRLREALEDIADRFDVLDCELTQDARTARDIARTALKEPGHD
jgi:serine/threonine protein kinase HipA of HipAB toxin-antitoxin module